VYELKRLLALLLTLGCGNQPESDDIGAGPAEGGAASGSSSVAGAAGSGGVAAAGANGGTAGAVQPEAGSGGSAGVAGTSSTGGAPSDAWLLDNLTAIAGVTPEIWGMPSVDESPYGPALCFSGDDGIVLAKNPLEGWAAFTLQVLFRPDPVLPEEEALSEPRFVHIETDAADRATVEARVNPTQFYLDTFISSTGQSKTLIDAARVHPVGQWHWAALSYADGTMRHYVDGIEDASASLTAAPLGPGKTSLGVRQNRLYWFKGCIRELRFAPRALPAESLERP